MPLTDGPYDFYDCWHRLVGTDGVIEIGRLDGPLLRYRRDGEDWTTIDVPDEMEGRIDLAIDDVVGALDGDGGTELDSENALKTMEILFAGHESSRRRGRVELPLTGVYDHPLETMIETGEIVSEHADDRPAHPSERAGEP